MSNEEPQLIVGPRYAQIVAVGAMAVAMLCMVLCVFLFGQTRYAADIGTQAAFATGKSQGELQALRRQLSGMDEKLQQAIDRLERLETSPPVPADEGSTGTASP